MPKTLLQKLWDTHVVREGTVGSAVLYIDRHFVNEVRSPKAFERLSLNELTLWYFRYTRWLSPGGPAKPSKKLVPPRLRPAD